MQRRRLRCVQVCPCEDMEEEDVTEERRCPRLGSVVPLSYCMESGEGDLPCWKVMDCWWELMDIKAYLQNKISPEDMAKLEQMKPKPKVTSLLELIEQAKKRTQKG